MIGRSDAVEADELEVGAVVGEHSDARPSVAHGPSQLGRRPTDSLRQVGSDRRAGRLGDQWPVAMSDADVATAEHPDRAVIVGEDVHLDPTTTIGDTVGAAGRFGVAVVSVAGNYLGDPPNRCGIGSDDRDPGRLTGLDQLDALERSRASEPHRVDVRLGQAGDHVVDRRRCPARAYLVGLPSEPRFGVDAVVDQHGRDRRRVGGVVEAADRVQDANRRFADLDDPEPVDGPLAVQGGAHGDAHDEKAACRSAATSSGIGAGSAIVS